MLACNRHMTVLAPLVPGLTHTLLGVSAYPAAAHAAASSHAAAAQVRLDGAHSA
jgi:hypothetical protein